VAAEAFAVPADALLGRKATVPEHVVYRDFVTETVVLNLETGHYHGINRTGGRILSALERAETIGAAASTLAEEYGRSVAEVERDVCAFCADLLDRGLILLLPDGGH
jgi:hypothetical protein